MFIEMPGHKFDGKAVWNILPHLTMVLMKSRDAEQVVAADAECHYEEAELSHVIDVMLTEDLPEEFSAPHWTT